MSAMALAVSGHCDALAAMGFTCMRPGCTAGATGHVEMYGGPHDGRLLLVMCPEDALSEEAVKSALADLALQSKYDPFTGGPGPDGEPEVQHGDHYDPLPRRC